MTLGRLVGLGFAVVILLIMFMAEGPSSAANPTALSVLPPMLAIGMAFLFRQVIFALFMGLWLGAWLVYDMATGQLFIAFLDTTQKYALSALVDADHMAIIIFTMLIAGMVGVVSENGGMRGVVDAIASWTNNRKRGQLGTAFMGMAIFFDDYANTLVVGNTMRPVTDRLKISREKLAYLVDSTAAPIASIALISTWVGYEVGLIGDAIKDTSILGEPYFIFLNTIAYSFYPILALVFVLMVARTGRDFGPMLAAEQKALSKDAKTPASRDEEGDHPASKARYAVVPLFGLIATVMIGIFITGEGDSIRDIVGSADSYKALIWGSLVGTAMAISMTMLQGVLTFEETFEAFTDGMNSVIGAVIILVMSWSLAEITTVLGTADYLVGVLGDYLPMAILPALVFLVAAITALGTGSSWGAMGILMPLVVPLVWAVVDADPANMHILYSSISCVLAGAVWGDHCSPISDTTILSSLASDCNHVEHVRTQMPYALTVGGVAVLLGTVPAGFGLPWWIGLLAGVAMLWFILQRFGQNPEDSTV